MIHSSSEFLEMMFNSPTNTIIIGQKNLNNHFFDLKTGIAGDSLQKVSNYHKRLIIPGNYQDITSKSLNDFIYESNKAGKILFVKDLDEAVTFLK